METLLDPIKADIHNWNLVRNTPIALNFLTSGTGFTIHKIDYDEWKQHNPTYIHCYFAINQFELQFYLIDNLSDASNNGVFGQNLVKKDFTRTSFTQQVDTFVPFQFNPIPGLSATDAKERIVNWSLSAETWFEHQITMNREILRVILIPFRDLEELFTNDTNDVFVFFAIRDYADLLMNEGLLPANSGEQRFNIELILSQMNPDTTSPDELNSNEQEFQDVTRPCPPFGGDLNDFGLLS